MDLAEIEKAAAASRATLDGNTFELGAEELDAGAGRTAVAGLAAAGWKFGHGSATDIHDVAREFTGFEPEPAAVFAMFEFDAL